MNRPDIAKAVTLLRAGGLVAFPTETVYGLGADANNALAVSKIFQAKGRPADHPLIVHVAHIDQLQQWVRHIPLAALELAQAFWPGPLTLILKKQPNVLGAVTANQDTVGIRIPQHPVALALLQAYGSGIAAPSANKFTHISPTTAAAVQEELGEVVDCILDGGACEVGLESTILDLSRIDENGMPTILRPGKISAQQISEVLHCEVIHHSLPTTVLANQTRAPGMHLLHYAPQTQTLLASSANIKPLLQRYQSENKRVAFLLHQLLVERVPESVKIVQMPTEANAYAHDLYDQLRSLDHQHLTLIVIEKVPNDIEWEAIRDRLGKATAAREIVC